MDPTTPTTQMSQASSTHSRNGSSDTTSSQTSAYHFILEHLLSYPGTYEPRGPPRSSELPLRSMYSLNSAAPALAGSAATSPIIPTTTNNSPVIPSSMSTYSCHNTIQYVSPPKQLAMQDNRVAAAVFKSNILDQIAQLPQQPASLPPAFVTSFLEKIFPMQLECIDFPQSLTALDYLKDLEMRRRKELAYALQRHGIERKVLDLSQEPQDLTQYFPAVANWAASLEVKEKKADKLYTQLYVALRRWILINEMALQPFNKHNCHAMLNTLYPPVEGMEQPSQKLTLPLLMVQREGFFNYVKAVEARGPMCLQTLMKQGARNGEENGWPAVKRTLNNYLNLANRMIRESQEISAMEVYANSTPQVPPVSEGQQVQTSPEQERKVDSGIGFNSTPSSEGKHSKNPSMSSSKTDSTNYSTTSRVTSSSFEFSRGSTLERLARELRKKMPKRLQVDEIVKHQPRQPSSAGANYKDTFSPYSPIKSQLSPIKTSRFSLRKMKSIGTLGELKDRNYSASSLRTPSPFTPTFDAEALKIRRRPFAERRIFS